MLRSAAARIENHKLIQMIFAEKNFRRFIIFFVLFLVAFGIFYLPAAFKWWFEDDPLQYFYVSRIANLIDVFTDISMMREFSKAFVPMQIFSYWIDFKFFGFNPLAAYIHSLISLLLTSLLLFAVMKRWTQNDLVSVATVLIWLITPSTLVVVQFLATRHYLEGLLFALASGYCLFQLDKENTNSALWLVAAALSGIAAMFCKEIYPPLIIILFSACGYYCRKYQLIFIAVFFAVLYGFCRVLVLGTDVTYTMPFLGIKDYAKFLLILPYTLTANNLGYIVYGGILIATAALIKKDRGKTKIVLLFAALLGSVLAALYPVAFAVLMNYKTPGTWYRVPFIINTLVIIWGVYAVSNVLERKKFYASLFLLALLILPGTWKTRKYWNERMSRAEEEGKFYLENPDKLLLSEEDAPWFIDGVHRMYKVGDVHYLNKQNVSNGEFRKLVLNYPTIWRYRNGEFTPDEKLYREITNPGELPPANGENR